MKNMAYWKSKNGLPGVDNDSGDKYDEHSTDKKHIGGNFKKKIMGSKLVKDLKEASNIVEDDINKLVGRKTHPGHGNEDKRGKLKRGYPKYDEKGNYIHKYWQK